MSDAIAGGGHTFIILANNGRRPAERNKGSSAANPMHWTRFGLLITQCNGWLNVGRPHRGNQDGDSRRGQQNRGNDDEG